MQQNLSIWLSTQRLTTFISKKLHKSRDFKLNEWTVNVIGTLHVSLSSSLPAMTLGELKIQFSDDLAFQNLRRLLNKRSSLLFKLRAAIHFESVQQVYIHSLKLIMILMILTAGLIDCPLLTSACFLSIYDWLEAHHRPPACKPWFPPSNSVWLCYDSGQKYWSYVRTNPLHLWHHSQQYWDACCSCFTFWWNTRQTALWKRWSPAFHSCSSKTQIQSNIYPCWVHCSLGYFGEGFWSWAWWWIYHYGCAWRRFMVTTLTLVLWLNCMHVFPANLISIYQVYPQLLTRWACSGFWITFKLLIFIVNSSAIYEAKVPGKVAAFNENLCKLLTNF